jgi:hypothetical protein
MNQDLPLARRVGQFPLAPVFSIAPPAASAAASRIERVEVVSPEVFGRGDSTPCPFSPMPEADEANVTSHWQVLYWRGGKVEVAPCRAGIDPSRSPLLVFRVHHDQAVDDADVFGYGAIEGVTIKEPVREGWKQDFDLAGNPWRLRAHYVRGTNGRVLPGSMQLAVEQKGGGQTSVVLDRAPGVVFSNQAVLWAGDLNGDGAPDFLIRRTLVTGEIDYVLSISNRDGKYVAGGITVDPDHAVNRFSAGMEGPEARPPRHGPHRSAADASPPSTPITPHYARSGATAVSGISIYANPQGVKSLPPGIEEPGLAPFLALTPGVKRDLSFTFEGETYRIVAEIIPTYAGGSRVPRYQPRLFFGAYGGRTGLSLTIALHHNGVRQVLLVTQPYMDDSDMRLTAGDLDGSRELSLSIDWWPNPNNAMHHVWKRVQGLGRVVKRVSSFQSQGC